MFERNPEIALLALAANSGQDRFSSVDLLENVTGIDDGNFVVQQLKEEIEANLKPDDVSKSISRISTRMPNYLVADAAVLELIRWAPSNSSLSQFKI